MGGPANSNFNPASNYMDDGSLYTSHNFTNKEDAAAYNTAYAAEQERLKGANTARKNTVDLLATNQGRSATMLTDPSKSQGIL